MKTILTFLAIVALAIFINACNESTDVTSPQSLDAECSNGVIYSLIAGQTDTVGTVHIRNDGTNFYITYTLTSPGCSFGTLQIWLGNDISNVPATPQGVPIPGQFCQADPNFCFDATGLTTYTFIIPASSIGIIDVNQVCNLAMYVFTHAEVNCGGSTETAWGGNNGVNVGTPGRWYFYGDYNICCNNGQPPVQTCNTAFAKGGWVWTTNRKSNPENLPSLNLTNNRWGWAINLTSTGSTTYDIWAGAGLNNTSKGKLVGSLTVVWDGANATVTYNMVSGYTMSEVHLYAGDDRPTTFAPGQYGNLTSFDPGVSTYIFNVPLSDINGVDGVWLIAHAVVCN